MAIQYEIRPNEEQIREAVALFEFVGGNIQDAIRVAINKAAPKIRTAASRAIRAQVRLGAAYVNERLQIRRATRGQLSGAISTPSRGLLLSRFSTDAQVASDKVGWFKAPPAPKLGIRVKVKPDGSPAVVTGGNEISGKPFYLALKNSGALAIAGRRRFPGPRGGKIEVFYGPSLSQVFNTVRDEVMPQAQAEYQAQLLDAMRYILVKKYPPEATE